MGLLSYLRGDDLRTDVHAPGEQRSLPRPDNELPLLGAYTQYGAFGEKSITPQKALQIADVWSAVRVLADAASSLPLHAEQERAKAERSEGTD
jgi:phage portal protein BeeE